MYFWWLSGKKVLDHGRPRKLTELEYERLQGLPDNYTNVEVNGRKISYTKKDVACVVMRGHCLWLNIYLKD